MKETETKMLQDENPIRKDWLRFVVIALYVAGFIGIVGLGVVEIVQAPLSSKEKAVEVVSGDAGQKISEKPTLTTLVIEPIVSNPKVITIIKHLFYLLVWIFLFLLFPIVFTRLKRLKLFNFEFELEKKEEQVINVLNVTTQKIYYLSEWAAEEKTNQFVHKVKQFPDVEDAIELMVVEMAKYYYDTWDHTFSYQILDKEAFQKSKKIPKIVRNTYDLAHERLEAIPINKENSDHIYFKNYLLTSINYDEQNIVVVLSSYKLEFDEYDSILLSGLVSLAIQYYEKAKMMGILESLDLAE
ncbi:hypothetical protein [Halalkalibacter urbisdiaboli]|uniref:hypothetical protein n=1 Tax=Halalkalibacter urbisdiaboli TaxID=1960589 RepID=UPI000B43A1DC|nr:hypothetical protein [Halalkalibacter urbisdiaboli]